MRSTKQTSRSKAGLVASLTLGAMTAWAADQQDGNMATHEQRAAALSTQELKSPSPEQNPKDKDPNKDQGNNKDGKDNPLTNFGVGIGAVFGGPGGGPVTDASIGADKRVHIDKQQNAEARLILEYHVWLATEREPPMLVQAVHAVFKDWDWFKKETWHTNVISGGLQFVVLTDTGNAKVDGFGGGYIMGVRKKGKEDQSWNLGIGAVLQNDYQQLGSGFTDGQPPPAGETAIRYKDRSALRGYVMASFSW